MGCWMDHREEVDEGRMEDEVSCLSSWEVCPEQSIVRVVLSRSWISIAAILGINSYMQRILLRTFALDCFVSIKLLGCHHLVYLIIPNFLASSNTGIGNWQIINIHRLLLCLSPNRKTLITTAFEESQIPTGLPSLFSEHLPLSLVAPLLLSEVPSSFLPAHEKPDSPLRFSSCLLLQRGLY